MKTKSWLIKQFIIIELSCHKISWVFQYLAYQLFASVWQIFNYQLLAKGPLKWMQHVVTTSSNIVGHNMSSFKHHVGTFWAVLDLVGRCWMKFDFCQTFHPTLANIFLWACALVAIHWYPISPHMSKRGHCDPKRHSVCIKNHHFVWSQNFVLSMVFTRKDFIIG